MPARCTRDEAEPADEPVAAPLSTELWHYTAYPGISGSHLGSTLKPGGAVLTLGVFRRSRSVACIRADASPSEVLAGVIVPPNSEGVNLARGHDARLPPVKRRATSRVNAHGRNANVDRDTLWLFMNHDGRCRGRPVGVGANIDVWYELRRAWRSRSAPICYPAAGGWATTVGRNP